MPKYKTKDGVIDTTDYTETQMVSFNFNYPDATIVEEDFQDGAAGPDAPVTPVMPNRASIIAGTQPKDTELPSEDTSSDLSVGDEGYLEQERKKGRAVSDIEREIRNPKKYKEYTWLYNSSQQKKEEKAQRIREKNLARLNKTPEETQSYKDRATLMQASVEAVTAETEKNEILSETFRIKDLDRRNATTKFGSGKYVEYLPKYKTDEDYEKYLKESLGNKYDRYKELSDAASKDNLYLTKSNISDYATLDDVDANVANAVVYKNQTEANQVYLRDVDEEDQTYVELYTGTKDTQKKKQAAYKAEVDRALGDQEKYKAATGDPLLEKTTYNGVTYDPVVNAELAMDKVEEQTQIQLGKDLEAFQNNSVDIQGDIKKLEDIQKQMKEYSTTDFENPDQVKYREGLIEKESSLLNKINAQIIVLNAESTSLTNRVKKGRIAQATDAALVKSYKTMDKLANVWDSAFVGSTKMVIGGIARAFGDEETYNAAVDYNQQLQEYSEKYLPAALTMDDSSSAWQYAGDMLVNNSPSIAVALATVGTGGIAAAGGGAVARAAATRTASRYASGLFFTMEAGGQLSNLEIAERGADEALASLREELKIAEQSGAGSIVINNIKDQIQVQEENKSKSFTQKAFNSIIYGGIAAGAERLGTLGFISNFQKYSKSVGGNKFRKLFGDAVGSRVAKNVGLLNATGIGAGIENIEEGFTLIGQNIADNAIFQPDKPKSIIEGLDGEFVRNTLTSSFAISGPSVSQNIYSQVANVVKTRKQSREEGAIRDELISIQAELDGLDKRTKKARSLATKRDELINKSAMENTGIMLNLKNLTGSEIETVFENDAEMRRLKLEAQDLDVTDNSPRTRAEFNRLKNKAQELFNANQTLLSRGEVDIEKFAKNTANPVEAEFNARRYNTFKYIAENNPNTNTVIIKDEADAQAYANSRFGEDSQANKDFMEDYASRGSNAEFDANGDLLLYEDVILNQIAGGGINAEIASVSPLHEIGHQQIKAAGIIKNDALTTSSANDLVKSILADVQSRFEQGKITQEEMDIFNQRMAFYKKQGEGMYTETEGVDADELIQLVGDFTALGILPKSSYNTLFGAKTLINNLLKRFNGDSAPYFNVNNANDVYSFVANFQNKAAAFELKKGVAGKGATKKSISAAAEKSNARVNLITKEQLSSPRSQSILFEEISNMAAAQIAGRYSLPPQTLEDFTNDVVGRIYLAKENEKWDGKGTLSGFLGGRISFRIEDVVRKEYKLNPAERQYLSTVENLRPEDQKDLMTEEVAPAVQEKPKYRTLVESKLLPPAQVKSVKQKIVSIARVLKSRLDAPMGKNASVTPIINELKKNLGKQIDIEFKTMLGKKKGGELKENVLKHKKAILENMTTTWLMQAMPFAIEKSVGGKYKVDEEGKRVKDTNGDFIFIPNYTREWEGKDIDRAKTSTQQQGKTSGPEISRRLTNASSKISDDQFLSYLFKDGEVIRGRKESLSKALAEEYGFDMINRELKDPDSDISKAFENNQEMLGMVIADNFVAEVSKQSERGLVKRSAIVNPQVVFRDALALEIDGDLDGSLALLETLSPEDRAAYEDITANIKVDTARYKQSLKKWKGAPKNIKALINQYFENNSARDNKQAMKEYYQFSVDMIDALPNALVKALGADFFGAHYRYLNPKEAKSLGAKIRSKIDALPNINEDIGFNPEDMRLIQAGSGIVATITKDILNKEFKTAQDKVDAFMDKYGSEVDALNVANKKAIEKVVSTALDISMKKPQQAVGFLRMLESTTNIGKSLRSLTGISDIQMTAASQAVYVNTKTGKGYSNTLNAGQKAKVESGEIVLNEKHPNYKEAKKFIADGSKQTIPQLIRIKGEHATPSSNFNVSVAKEFLTSLSIAMENPGGKQIVKDALIAKVNELTIEFNQQLNTKVLSDLQDAKLGATSDIGDLRLLAIPLESQNAFYDMKGLQTIGRVQSLMNTMFSPKNVAERAKIATEQKAINNARKKSYAANPKGISVYDFDDTLATTKSNVMYSVPNSEGGFSDGTTKLKAIFMVGGPGAGKTNVGKGLQLGRRGYKVVNQDIALEAMKTEVGLPNNESDYTAEQRSMRSKLGAAARKAAVAKFDKYAEAGNGMVIDGTGASYNATTKKIKALEEQGFEVHMVVATTPLSTALERNRARKERSLKDFVVEKTYNQVQESLAQYRKDFGDRLYEINTETIEYGKPLPNDFLQEVYAGINKNKVNKIDATQFAKQGESLANAGAKFDFSDFNKVVKGEPGPLAPRLKKAIDKFGNENIFVLTARPAESATAIHAFLKGLGMEIPLENITGLANGSPAAKASWMIGKVADGYNDFYFVDDHMGNVKAVKDVLNVFDVKGKVQQARVKRSAALGKGLNEMIERNKGIDARAVYSKVRASKEGASKGKFKVFIPYGADDFRGLTSYTLAGKGKQGEADQKFFEDNLVKPYMRGISAMEKARRALKNDYLTLLKQLPGMKKMLGKQIGDTDYTVDQAVRVYLWTQQGTEIPGISKRDQKKLNSLVSKDPALTTFAAGLQAISKQEKWVTPSEHWIASTVLRDINEIGEKVTRSEYLQEFNENVDIVFDEKNMTKLEALYGTRYVDALRSSISRMKSGRNRPAAPGKYEQKWLNWVNNSVGTIMFFNRRSAAMQMLSFANFVNWSDNNPIKAAAAFANQPAYWKAWSTIFNSDKLKERRGGLKSDVQEQEIANQAKNSKDKASAVVAYLLKIGFTPTQIADSFAIATGGATFLINRTKTYKKQGLSQAEAEAKAFEDFSSISDETQQSGDPMLVSAQQSSHLGRLVLAFQNTPMQYTRLMKKAGQDLINGRGDVKTNISKIAYYGFVQNLIFSALQNALFALIPGFDDEEETEEQKEKIINTKTERIINSMVDTILRGSGLTGAVISTLKNTINRYYKEEKKGFTADHTYTILELANISPPIGSKFRKVYGAIQTKKFDRDVIEEQGFDVNLYGKFNVSPSYEILGSLASAGLNIPLDRALSEIDGISEALDSRNSTFQRIALGLGWRSWDVNAGKEEEDYVKLLGARKRKEEGKQKAKATREKTRQDELDRLSMMTPSEKAAYLSEQAKKRAESARKAAKTRRENKLKKYRILNSQ